MLIDNEIEIIVNSSIIISPIGSNISLNFLVS